MGSHAGTQNLVYVTGEVGIGGGMIVHGKPLLGSRGYGGEIGHMTLDPDGPACGCGRRGCWESYVGLNALLRASGTMPGSAGAPPGSADRPPGSADPPPGSPEDKIMSVVTAAGSGDRRILAALAELGRYLGIGAANIAKIVNPEVIILGGYFTALAEWILPPPASPCWPACLPPAQPVASSPRRTWA